MGRLDQYAKQIFATETAVVTSGAVEWQPPTEIHLTDVRLDGSLLVRDPARLGDLPDPWPLAVGHDEIVFEAKMQGDHLDLYASERACLRRQARQVRRMEDKDAPWDGDTPLWLLASRVPAVLRARRTVREVGAGCYRIETGSFQYLWIAANELPLVVELLPFLIARSGAALDELARWAQAQRSRGWIAGMVDSLPMSMAAQNELMRFILAEPEDEEMAARQKLIAKLWVENTPEVMNEVHAKADVARLRRDVRRVLARRKLALTPDEEARIDACTDVTTLERWHEQAVDAATVAEALKA